MSLSDLTASMASSSLRLTTSEYSAPSWELVMIYQHEQHQIRYTPTNEKHFQSLKCDNRASNMKAITQQAWSEVHQKACDIANASMMNDGVLVSSHTAAMFDILHALETKFGRQPAIIATRADYVEDIDSKRQLFAEALALARELGDKTEEAEILDSLQTLHSER